MTTWIDQRRLRRRRRRRTEEIIGWIIVPPMLIGIWWGGTYVYETFKEPITGLLSSVSAIKAKGSNAREP